jgi:hypothetical protein
MHPEGGCGFKSHGTYSRKKPAGARVPRWYCPKEGVTFSLLSDCLAARYTAELQEIEDVVEKAEAAPSQERAVESLWPEIGLVAALRKLRRWRSAITTALNVARGLLPELGITRVSIAGLRERLSTTSVLRVLREKLAAHLHALPAPLGFGPRPKLHAHERDPQFSLRQREGSRILLGLDERRGA